MKTSDIGLDFDSKLSKTPWAKLTILDGNPDELWFGTAKTPLGPMTVIGDGDVLCYLGFEEKRSIEKCAHFFRAAEFVRDDKQAARMVKTILSIWQGKSQKEISVMIGGTPFQKKVWAALLKIPTGSVVSYQTIAESISSPRAVRAVGGAVGSNPLSLIIPCHRVVQKNGSIENYGWGNDIKCRILKQEGVTPPSKSPASRKTRRVV